MIVFKELDHRILSDLLIDLPLLCVARHRPLWTVSAEMGIEAETSVAILTGL